MCTDLILIFFRCAKNVFVQLIAIELNRTYLDMEWKLRLRIEIFSDVCTLLPLYIHKTKVVTDN